MPALQIRDLGTAKTAVNTFALGDLWYQPALAPMHDWDVHYDWLQAIYSNHFGLRPAITLTGPGANYVLADYRFCTKDRKSTRLNSSHRCISYAVFCLKKKKK